MTQNIVIPAQAGIQCRSFLATDTGSWVSRRSPGMTQNIVIPAKTSPKDEVSRNGQAGIQCRLFLSTDTGSRVSRCALARDDATVSDRRDASRLALGQLRHLAVVCVAKVMWMRP